MPTVQYVDQANNVRITKPMVTPKKMARIEYWFKGARKAIPEILAVDNGVWMIGFQEANAEWIRFDLISAKGERRYVVIMRKESNGL